mmetsp:Transcript_38074/g.58102  ORF Transcript_38074/g.58102 Transcript_38074/m.58102 type:complete len:144 (-) Transcript_38074:212-643(-)|eukprot:CAMPEP_0170505404 /NCGR_PEP_ID=MMETSP0208-20121228/50799_1 /TAXON_ID=197538 /ORGANISM="Strombidium inclinatum, Strain S3" /LENGTH=143 /DNA_ID=CAMNT_0010786243 /DNA_START=363 /DNA_END=794 /DNA_ORIENTATION=+
MCDFGLARTVPWQENAIANTSKPSPKRRLSNHVCTRWYRPPEIILLEKEYDSRVDIWGAGCTVAEILSSTTPYVEQGLNPEDRYVFQGASCYPLSPAGNDVKDGDQMQIILHMLGRQSDASLRFVGNGEVANYVRVLQKECTN